MFFVVIVCCIYVYTVSSVVYCVVSRCDSVVVVVCLVVTVLCDSVLLCVLRGVFVLVSFDTDCC